MRTISRWATGIGAATMALGAGLPALAQAPAAGTPTQPGTWGRHGWMSGSASAPAATMSPATAQPLAPAPLPTVVAPATVTPAAVETPVRTPQATLAPVSPLPHTVRTGPNTVVTTSTTTVAPPVEVGAAWNGAQVVSVTPGYVVTTTTRSSEVIRRPSRASRSALARR